MDQCWEKWGDTFTEQKCVEVIKIQCAKVEDDFGAREKNWIRVRIEQLQFGESVNYIRYF